MAKRRELAHLRRFGPKFEFDVHAGSLRLVRGSNRFVAQHFGGAGLQKQRREAAEIGEQRRHLGVRVQARGRDVVTAQHQQVAQAQQGVAVLVVDEALAGEGAVHTRRQQHGAAGQRLVLRAGALQRDERQVGAGRVTAEYDACGIAAAGEQPAIGRLAVVGSRRKRVLRREPAVRNQRARPGAEAQACRECLGQDGSSCCLTSLRSANARARHSTGPWCAAIVDGAAVTPQPGGFYGGWITPELVGPFKGKPGSEAW